MRQTLFTIPHEVFGLPLFGAGWLLILWAVFCAAYLAWLFRRQGFNAETRGYLPVFVVVALMIWLLLPRLEMATGLGASGLPIRGYGVMLLIAVCTGVGLAAWRAKSVGIAPDLIYSLAFWMFALGIFGARLFYIAQNYQGQFQRETLAETLAAMANVTQGGLVVYGSFIGALAAAFFFVRRHALPALAVADLIAPSLLIGLSIGRIGCLLNGCCYGDLSQQTWALQFPAQSPPYARQHQLGLLHGIRLGENKQGQVVVQWVAPHSAAQQAGVSTGAVVKSIQLPPVRALRGALAVADFAGKNLTLETDDGRSLSLPIPADALPSQLDLRRFGIEGITFEASPMITSLTPGGAANIAGLAVGDRIVRVRFPEIKTAAALHTLMQFNDRSMTLEFADGRAAHWSVERLPKRSLPVHPTQIYSSINGALLFFFLWVYYPFRRHDGEVFALLITLYPITRILLEIIRTDEPGLWGTSLTISQWVSAGVLFGAVGLWAYISRKPSGGRPKAALAS